MRTVRSVLSVLAVVAVPCVPGSVCGNTGVLQTAPNVLFFVVDDLNDWISLLDPAGPINTPNLQRLAERGMLFTRAYCMSAACNPSRAATLTGLRPTTTGVYGNKSNWRGAVPTRHTIMQQFLAAGYDVRGAGKIFHHQLNGAFHDDASFAEFQHMPPQKYPPDKLNGAPEYGSRNTDWGVWPPRVDDAIDFHTARYCVDVLCEPVKEQPLFLACGIFKPHSPFFAPAAYHAPYREIGLPTRRNDDWNDLPPGAVTLLKEKQWFWEGMMRVESRKPGAYRDFIRAYAACATFADAQIGKVLDALDAGPRRDNTIIVLWADHGFHLGEKDHIEKFALWEKTNHIPLIVVAPGVTRPGSCCDRPVDTSVLYPTLLELCGLPADSACDGLSIVPLLRDPDAPWERPALMTYGRGNHAVRSDRWRYIRYADGSEELYDHENDPHEWTNLADRPEYAAIIAEHQKWLPRREALPVPNLRERVGAASAAAAGQLCSLSPDESHRVSVGPPRAASVDVTALESPVLLRGDETHAYRDPTALYHNGEFHLFYTYNPPPDDDGKVYWFTAVSKSRDLRNWTEPRPITPRDQRLNYSSPGNVIRFENQWVLCLQTYPIPGFRSGDPVRYGDASARIFIIRSHNLIDWSEPELLRVKGPEVPVGAMGRMIDPYLIEDRDEPGKWWCFFKQNGASRAWSRDLKTWTYAGHFSAGENVCVIRDGTHYVLFHSPSNGIGVKRSADLANWRDEGLLTLGQADWPWARNGRLTAAFVLDLRRDPAVGKALMFFHASAYSERTRGFYRNCSLAVAWSDDLENWSWPGKAGR